MTELSHNALVALGERWLRGPAGCRIVLSELVAITPNGEKPDVIGWGASATTMLIECKTSRADYLADRNKRFRRVPATGMGMYRYFLAPAGLLSPAELPERWGLLEVDEHRRLRLIAGYRPKNYGDENRAAWRQERCIDSETRLLLSALSRIEQGIGAGELRRLAHQRIRRETDKELQARSAGTAPAPSWCGVAPGATGAPGNTDASSEPVLETRNP